ncbi:hypothetical protein [Phytoactinopolyspora mesophila]|uniref:Uncharacterized protein n=1 Tax=Phytoactinopolyspora mesophila TaxID=2650750 RepID=A0A7K3M9X0_9ACTN|nr:hypothetical protein [Phytoactinopolyspora mesophila]NDL60084.1 hypothetical protein [Phytoactinopolyspora mesophila]
MRARSLCCFAAMVAFMVGACSADEDSSVPGPIEPGATSSPDDQPSRDQPPQDEPTPEPEPEPTLPNGATSIFPEHRLVGFSGGRSPAFGRLDAEDLDGAAAELDEIIPDYEVDGRTVLPVYELIAIIAHPSPTASGLYRTVEPDEVIRDYLEAAREHEALLLLNVQPGRSGFLDDVQLLEEWLREPDVGLALDPEWAVGDGEVPGQTYGSTTGSELDSVAEYVSALVAEENLPEKVIVFHQVHESVVEDEDDLGEHPGVEIVKSVDGIGARADKEATWDRVIATMPEHVRAGFKLFFEEDTRHGPLMTPEQVLALEPLPEYVLYE